MTFFCRGKKGLPCFHVGEKKTESGRDASLLIEDGFLFGKYSLHVASRVFSGKIGRLFND